MASVWLSGLLKQTPVGVKCVHAADPSPGCGGESGSFPNTESRHPGVRKNVGRTYMSLVELNREYKGRRDGAGGKRWRGAEQR